MKNNDYVLNAEYNQLELRTIRSALVGECYILSQFKARGSLNPKQERRLRFVRAVLDHQDLVDLQVNSEWDTELDLMIAKCEAVIKEGE